MAPELSSNWKKLQATLKQDAKHKVTKSKTPLDPRRRNALAKRIRLDNKAGRMGNIMGVQQPAAEDTAPSASLALWAEDNDISAQDLADAYGVGMKETSMQGAGNDEVNAGLAPDVEVGQYIAMDCEMVGVGGAEDRSVLARVSIVNFHGVQVYDSFVKPKEFVTDWRTHVSGVSPRNMATARSFEDVQAQVADLLRGRVLIGHAVRNDLDAMLMGHPKKDTRDTSRFSGFRRYSAGRTPSLKKLAKEILGVDIQGGEHSSIEDARATMLLFRRHKQAFEVEHAKKFPARLSNGETKPKKKGKAKR